MIDDGNGQQDTSSRSDGSHEVSEDGKSTNTDSSKGSSSWDVSVELLNHGFLSHTFNKEILVNELSSNVSGAGPGDVDPDSREEGAGAEDEEGVDDGVDWVLLDVVQALGWTDVVSESTDGGGVSSHVVVLPLSEETDDEVATELAGEDLREEVDVGDEGALEDDGDVGSVEQFDWEGLSVTSHLSAAQTQFNSETLNWNTLNLKINDLPGSK